MVSPSVADYPRGARMRPRVIDDFEFVWMLLGQALFVTEDEEIALSPGNLLLVSPGVRHGFVWDQRRASRHGYMHFPPELVGGRDPVLVRSRRMTAHDPLAGLCNYLTWLGREQPDGWEHQVRQTLRFLLPCSPRDPCLGRTCARCCRLLFPPSSTTSCVSGRICGSAGLASRNSPPQRVCHAAISIGSSRRSSGSVQARHWKASVAPEPKRC